MHFLLAKYIFHKRFKKYHFFIYDDRGCEVIANNKETIRPLYNQYKNWLGEYDKEKIELLFN